MGKANEFGGAGPAGLAWLRLLLALWAMGMFASLALADTVPTLDQVYQAAHSGRMMEARQMMDVVLKAHPNSAKAHYVAAQILAGSGALPQAARELKAAESLAPGLPFAKPESVRELKARIAAGGGAGKRAAGLPWGMILLALGGLALVVLLARAMAARNRGGQYMPAPNGMGNGPYPAGPYGGPAGPAPGGGLGSSLGSGLATGLGIGAGIAAGEALAHGLLDRGQGGSQAGPVPGGDSWGGAPDDMGGNDFGIGQGDSSWDDAGGISDDFSSGDDWN